MSHRIADDVVAVTGMGVVSSIGTGLHAFHDALVNGRSGTTPFEFPWPTGYRQLKVGRVRDIPITPNGIEDNAGRASQFALTSTLEALDHAGVESPLRDPERVGVVAGTTLGDADVVERRYVESHRTGRPVNADDMQIGSLADRVARGIDAKGPTHLVATTCAAGNHAIAWSSRLIRSGAADMMVAVAADTVGYTDALGFTRLLIQAPERCQPFDLHRKGTILSEGSAALVLEPLTLARARGAVILGIVAGCGLSCDAAGPFASNPGNLRGMEVAFRRALRSAGLTPDAIDHVSAHGSATRLNDHKETLFLKRVLGDRAREVPVTGLKGALGHAQGAASMLEAVASLSSFEHDLVYPTLNYETPDPKCDLDYVPNHPREQRVNTILSNAFGVGGNNALVIFQRWNGHGSPR